MEGQIRVETPFSRKIINVEGAIKRGAGDLQNSQKHKTKYFLIVSLIKTFLFDIFSVILTIETNEFYRKVAIRSNFVKNYVSLITHNQLDHA